jgi:hypothetical protein
MEARKRRGYRMPPITYHLSLITLLLQCGCTYLPNTVSGGDFLTPNYLSYEHPFTDAAAAGARKTAERECSYRKQVAVRTGGTCSLTRCTTNFQCMGQKDAVLFQASDGKK